MPRYRSARSRFSWSKLVLAILTVVCALAVIWTGYLLYTQKLSQVTAIIILAVVIAVLIWDAFLLSRHKVGPGVAFAAFVVTSLVGSTVCAFSCIEPFVAAKRQVAYYAQSFSSPFTQKLPLGTVELSKGQIPSASQYPADISGRVIIPERVIAKWSADAPDPLELTHEEGKVWWIIEVSVRNKAYKEPITSRYQDWPLKVSDGVYYAKSYQDQIRAAYPLSVPSGGTGQTTFRFLVPDTLKVGEAQLAYRGSEGVSYGALSGGERVPLYDWDSKTVINEPFETFWVYGKKMRLRTVASWSGNETAHIRYVAGKSPWVVNWSYDQTSKIASNFYAFVITEVGYQRLDVSTVPVQGGLGALVGIAWTSDKDGSIVVPQAGSFVIVVEASGVHWRVKVGME